MTPERPPTKRQQQAAATQEQLLTAAREVFEEKGYQATTVGAITDRANTAHGTFYLYFRNKEDAFSRVMADVVAQLYEEASAPWAKDPEEGIEIATRGFLSVYAAHAGLWRCLLEGMLQSPNIEKMWLDLRRNFIERIARNLRRQQQIGGVRALDADLAAHALGAMTEWFAFSHFVLDEPHSGDDAVDRSARTLTDLWHHAIYGHIGAYPAP